MREVATPAIMSGVMMMDDDDDIDDYDVSIDGQDMQVCRHD